VRVAFDYSGTRVLVTGGSNGIGLGIARAFLEAGADVTITGTRKSPGDYDHDLAGFAYRRCVLTEPETITEVAAALDRLDVLVNNAGLILRRRTETEDGFEATFGINHLGHFLLTDLLLDRLQASAPARVVVVASDAHQSAKQGLDFDDLQSTRHYRFTKVYGKSKLANIYFARELARRLEGTGVTSNSLHPGFVRSEFGRGGDLGTLYGFGIKYLAAPFAISPENGALTTIYLASSPDVEGATGGYYVKRRRSLPSKVAQDDDAARRLWEVSEQLVASVPA
jgi:NAD(P)-dependent dehydrogenase (short-subunit alcohol dehydrogenase family)